MKPLTRVYPFFDKQNVTQYVTPTGGSLGGNLVTTASGAVSGVFAIQIQTQEVIHVSELVKEYSDLHRLQQT